MRSEALRKLALFANCRPEFVTWVLDDVDCKFFQPGDIILEEGDKGTSCYILHFGTVSVESKGEVVAHLGQGAIFGEVCLMGLQKVRSATVRADTVCDIRVLQRERFLYALKLFPNERLFFQREAERKLSKLKEFQYQGKVDAQKHNKQKFTEAIMDRFKENKRRQEAKYDEANEAMKVQTMSAPAAWKDAKALKDAKESSAPKEASGLSARGLEIHNEESAKADSVDSVDVSAHHALAEVKSDLVVGRYLTSDHSHESKALVALDLMEDVLQHPSRGASPLMPPVPQMSNAVDGSGWSDTAAVAHGEVSQRLYHGTCAPLVVPSPRQQQMLSLPHRKLDDYGLYGAPSYAWRPSGALTAPKDVRQGQPPILETTAWPRLDRFKRDDFLWKEVSEVEADGRCARTRRASDVTAPSSSGVVSPRDGRPRSRPGERQNAFARLSPRTSPRVLTLSPLTAGDRKASALVPREHGALHDDEEACSATPSLQDVVTPRSPCDVRRGARDPRLARWLRLM